MTDAAFWDKIADKYATHPISNEEAYAATLTRVRHWLATDMTVLEIGCGTGSTALRLADAAGQIVGTDISPEMVRIAAAKPAPGTVTFEVAKAEAAGAGRRFDAVMTFNLLHLVADRDVVMRHVRGLLPEGGLFISKTPCLGGKPWFRPLIWAMRCIGKAPPSVGHVTPEMLHREIEAAGFEVVETGDYPKKLPNHFVVARAI